MQFFKGVVKAPPEQPPEERDVGSPQDTAGREPPLLCPGMQVEVMTVENHLLFVGELTVLDGGILELRRSSGGALPQAIPNSRVKLQGVQKNSEPFVLEGTVERTCLEFWQIWNLKVLEIREGQRGFFRQTTDLEARVMPEGHFRSAGHMAEPCRVLDISASGVRISTKHVYREGEAFLLEAELHAGEPPFSLVCTVVRAEAKTEHRFEYGCRFGALDEQERHRLLRAIFTIQRKMSHSRRSRDLG